ncbi:hypothetical protein HMPREF1139_1510 [Campylobacter sp. FOBRC14]|nr:hypothetical protein HMPREF1139_1510 [Campylobacter sp. FOBRC14]
MLCPYCNNDFGKDILRKTKCKMCGNFVFIRTKDGIKTPMTQEQKEQFDYILSITPFGERNIDEIESMFKKEIVAAKKQLKDEFGNDIPRNDIIFRALNIALIRAYDKMDFSEIFYVKSALHDFFCCEKRYEQALEIAFEIFMLNLNDADNWHYWDDEGKEHIEYFRPQSGFITMTGWIKIAKSFLELNDNEFEKIFFDVYKNKLEWLKMPLGAAYMFSVLEQNL